MDTAPNSPVRGLSFVLRENAGRLELAALHHPRYDPICADWTAPEVRRRVAGGRKQLLARAAGLHKRPGLRLLDATGGLGRDAFTLAALGAQVGLAEREPTVFRLLEDAHRRALADPAAAAAARHIELLAGDARGWMTRGWDVIYLDPMYPHDGKTALAKKELQLLRELSGGDEDSDSLLGAALANARQRVVVKRPVKAPPLADRKPSLALTGTQARFDIYLCAS